MKKVFGTGFVIALVALVGFGTAFGYGGGGGGGYATPAQLQSLGLTPTVDGKVLGASSFKFEISLKKGNKSDAVKELQERLRAEGYFTYPTSTGFFGPITFNAVKAFQKANNLPVTGLAGSMTRAILNK